MQWTKEQSQIIEQRDSDILVSAAAGSGKTAVLVERILSKVLDENNPKDIDEFLVVTFTNAAAAQMREKIANKLEAALENNPGNEHLMKQLVLVNRADIITIDSFCLKLVKEYFSVLGIDSAFSVADPAMMELIKNDLLDEIFEEKYNEPSKGEESIYCNFHELIDCFCQDKDDEKLKEAILKINNTCESFPEPCTWLTNARKVLLIEDEDEFQNTTWIVKLVDIIRARLKDALGEIQVAEAICGESGGPDNNIPTVELDKELVEKLLLAKDYRELCIAFKGISWARMKSCKKDLYDEDLVNEFKAVRESYKKNVNGLNVFAESIEAAMDEVRDMRRYLIPILNLVEEFREKYNVIKNERKLLEFSDIEHLAYNLVASGQRDENNNLIPSEIGSKISNRYDEIFIDEYQDSNFLQEDILCCVSKHNNGIYNMFMVGDVKQSIYRFRMARPDLFIDKYNRFSDSGNEIKIELKNNFRSRAEVLNSINYFCYQLMGRDLGGIEYDKNVALVPTKEFPPYPEEHSGIHDTEIILGDYEVLEDASKRLDKMQMEALIIANRIKELVDPDNGMLVFDEDLGEYRRASYKDIVILSRSIKGFGQTVSSILRDEGIPVYVEEPKGYFEAVEIRLIMSLLAVVDNSRQDIPLAAVLLSPIANLTENELAVICNYSGEESKSLKYLFDKCDYYLVSNDDDISKKLNNFFITLDELKKCKVHMSIQQLIWHAISITGYYDYAKAMPLGKQRKANIDMLLEKAAAYENGYYKGLFNFLKYVEKLKVNDLDFGEANLIDESADVVKIVSMHKSKGLEYPIVFVSGMAKQFNKFDYTGNFIVHSDYYLAGILYDSELRYKKNSSMKKSFAMLFQNENIAEEIRILYVALTRAKEKLIITACDKKIAFELEDAINRASLTYSRDEKLLPFTKRSENKNFIGMLMSCFGRYFSNKNIAGLEKDFSMSVKIATYEELVSKMVEKAVDNKMSIFDIRNESLNMLQNETYKAIKSIIEYEYPYKRLADINGKMSISEIKRMKAFDGQGFDVPEPEEQDLMMGLKNLSMVDLSAEASYEDVDEEDVVDKTSTKSKFDNLPKGKFSGADRGTIIHKFMELLDFKGALACDRDYYKLVGYVEDCKRKLLASGAFDADEAAVIYPKSIARMLSTELGNRMAIADSAGRLHKEQQFSIGIKVKDIYSDMETIDSDDVVIVQGIVDGYFIEDDQLVVMDYKTDNADEETMIGRYKAQLDYYASTLEQLTGKKVKEKLLYSFKLGKEIQV